MEVVLNFGIHRSTSVVILYLTRTIDTSYTSFISVLLRRVRTLVLHSDERYSAAKTW